MADTLKVDARQPHGKRQARRLRASGEIPAVLYGHGEATVSLAVPALAFGSVVRHGGRVVELNGAVNEKAFIRDVQWDTYGIDVLHVDFTRVSEHERVKLRVVLEVRGQAPGLKEGGIVEQLVHDLEIECEASSIPDKLAISVNDLHLNDSLTAAQVPLPAGGTLLSDADTIVVQCVLPQGEVEGAVAEAGTAEPEVIGRKAEEEESEG